jgi:hypothetical protein
MRTSITTTSGRARSASWMASRPEPGLRAHQHILRGLEKRLHAASHDLVIIDEQHAQRWGFSGTGRTLPLEESWPLNRSRAHVRERARRPDPGSP